MAEENRRDDELINRTEGAEAEKGGGRELQAANLFDLRRIIGGLFVLYGVILTITGLFDTQAEIDKAAGVHINLWVGIAMLILGGLFLLWAFTRPLGEQLAKAERESEQARRRPGDDGEGAVGARDAGR
jgi:hypothetical protein